MRRPNQKTARSGPRPGRAVITVGGHRVPTLYRQPALACSASPENKYPGGARGWNALADPLQRRRLVTVFAERVTQGKASWFAAIHQSGADAHNPHAHIVIRDRDPETGKRVALLSEKGACQKIRLLWEQAVNAALEALGGPQRVTRLSHAARGIETPPQRHRGPQRREDEREEENKPDVAAPAPTVGLAFETASGKKPRMPHRGVWAAPSSRSTPAIPVRGSTHPSPAPPPSPS